MRGNQLAAALKKVRGGVSVQMLCPNDVAWVFAEKADLVAWAKKYGEDETGMVLSQEENGAGHFLQTDYSV